MNRASWLPHKDLAIKKRPCTVRIRIRAFHASSWFAVWVPEGTLCLITALARHGLTDVIPDRTDVAIPRGRRIPALQSLANVHVFAKDTFDVGRGRSGSGTV